MIGYYIYEDGSNVPYGVRKKIKNQVDVFEKNLGECYELPIGTDTSFIGKIKKRVSLISNGVKWDDGIKAAKADYVYIRKSLFTLDFVSFIKKIKKINIHNKIIIEIPTYPYDGEIISSGIKMWPLLLKDRIARKYLQTYVDYLAVIGRANDKIWNIPVIHICNGVQMDKIRLRVPQNNSEESIKLVCAANFSQYHGIDRLLKGLECYYRNDGDKKVEVHLAGDGPELQSLKNIVDKSDYLKPYVIFYGKLNSNEINELYDKCDLGIVTLGYSRIGLDYNTTIKSKEYLAAGLPFIVDTDIDVLDSDKNYPFIYKVEYGESELNIGDIIEFYEKNITYDLNNRVRIADEMRELAQECADFEINMQKVIDVIKER